MEWTVQMKDLTRQLWADKRSYTQISAALLADLNARVSRNSVASMVSRMNLPKRDTPRKASKPRAAYRAEHARRRGPAPPPATPIPVTFDPPPPGGVTLMEIGVDMCRWPHGDPLDSTFRFCGGQTGGERYCPMHSRQSGRAAEERSAAMRRKDLERARSPVPRVSRAH